MKKLKWESFSSKRSVTKEPVITICKKGNITFNKGFSEKHISKREYVKLYHAQNEGKHIIGFKFMNEKIRPYKMGKPNPGIATRIIRPTGYFKKYSINPIQFANTYTPEISEDGIHYITLN